MNYSLLNQYNNTDFINGNDKKLHNPIDVVQNIKNYNFNLYEEKQKNNWGNISDNILKGTIASSPLSQLFFSTDNVNRLQQKIKYEVYKRSEGKFLLETNQNESDLLIVMRAVFISDAINSPYRIVHQVKQLNHLTIERIVSDMISHIVQEDLYLNQLDKPVIPIALPVCVSVSGRKSLPSAMKTFF